MSWTIEVLSDSRSEGLPSGSDVWTIKERDDGLQFLQDGGGSEQVVWWKDVEDYNCEDDSVLLRMKDDAELNLKTDKEVSDSIKKILESLMISRVYVVEDPSSSLPEMVTLVVKGDRLEIIDTVSGAIAEDFPFSVCSGTVTAPPEDTDDEDLMDVLELTVESAEKGQLLFTFECDCGEKLQKALGLQDNGGSAGGSATKATENPEDSANDAGSEAEETDAESDADSRKGSDTEAEDTSGGDETEAEGDETEAEGDDDEEDDEDGEDGDDEDEDDEDEDDGDETDGGGDDEARARRKAKKKKKKDKKKKKKDKAKKKKAKEKKKDKKMQKRLSAKVAKKLTKKEIKENAKAEERQKNSLKYFTPDYTPGEGPFFALKVTDVPRHKLGPGIFEARSGWTLPLEIKMDLVEIVEGKTIFIIKLKLPEHCIYKKKLARKSFADFSSMCIPKVDQSPSKDIKFPSLTIRDAETRRKLLQAWLRDLITRGNKQNLQDPCTKNVLLSFLYDVGPAGKQHNCRPSHPNPSLPLPLTGDKAYVAKFTTSNKNLMKYQNDRDVARAKLDDLRIDIEDMLNPGEGNEHKAQDIVEDPVTIGKEDYIVRQFLFQCAW
jgi:hypothetical protein